MPFLFFPSAVLFTLSETSSIFSAFSLPSLSSSITPSSSVRYVLLSPVPALFTEIPIPFSVLISTPELFTPASLLALLYLPAVDVFFFRFALSVLLLFVPFPICLPPAWNREPLLITTAIKLPPKLEPFFFDSFFHNSFDTVSPSVYLRFTVHLCCATDDLWQFSLSYLKFLIL